MCNRRLVKQTTTIKITKNYRKKRRRKEKRELEIEVSNKCTAHHSFFFFFFVFNIESGNATQMFQQNKIIRRHFLGIKQHKQTNRQINILVGKKNILNRVPNTQLKHIRCKQSQKKAATTRWTTFLIAAT